MTIDTSREAVEQLAETHDNFEDYPDLYDMGKRPPCKKTAQVLTALLAERDAALAEVARLSTPPDDAEVAALVAELGEPLVIIEGYSADYVDTDDVRERMGKAADAITRLSHAHAAERKLADDLADGLVEARDQVWRDTAWHLKQNETLAAHAARRKE